MDMHARNQYLQQLQVEYLATKVRRQRSHLLDEAVKRTGLARKYLVVKLRPSTRWKPTPRKQRSATVTYHSDLILPLVQCWEIFGQPCGQRLAPLLATELERLRTFGELTLTANQARLLTTMSARTVDRLLGHEKAVRLICQRSQPKHPLLYQLVPTKTSDEFDRTIPGQIQADGVEHCGATTEGEYVNSIPTVDAGSYWWEATAVMGKGQRVTERALDRNRQRTPFPWKELHPDNGTSFLNWHLWRYANRTKLDLSRSRPYHKNDNCFIEQSHRTSVRAYVGHARYDTPAEMRLVNELYDVLRLYKNFFQPVLRLKTKERIKGHVTRRYEPAKTPYQWLMDHPAVPAATKETLSDQYERLNPADLRRQIDTILAKLAVCYDAKHARLTTESAPGVQFDFSLAEQPIVRLDTTVA